MVTRRNETRARMDEARYNNNRFRMRNKNYDYIITYVTSILRVYIIIFFNFMTLYFYCVRSRVFRGGIGHVETVLRKRLR